MCFEAGPGGYERERALKKGLVVEKPLKSGSVKIIISQGLGFYFLGKIIRCS